MLTYGVTKKRKKTAEGSKWINQYSNTNRHIITHLKPSTDTMVAFFLH